MRIPISFLLSATQAGFYLNSDRTMHKDVVWPAIASYQAMVRRMLMLFMEYDDLHSITLACITRLEVDETEDSHLVRRYQSITISTEGADIMRYESERIKFVSRYVPFHRMGTGAFALARNSREVAAILRDEGSSDADGWCWMLACMAHKCFKEISTDMHIEQTVE